MKDEMIVLTDAVLVTCIVQRGVADAVVNAALRVGAQGATVFYALHPVDWKTRAGLA